MTIFNKILKLLKTDELTTEQIAGKMGLKKEKLWSHISILKKQNRIIKINIKRPYIYTSITPEALVYRLYLIMITKMDAKIKLNNLELRFVNIAGEMVENE
ncbi:hypothetical protein LCGC14_0770230 [marine sediment metagenome]|uniref:HTH arsR-type domain-containing protein n=1 Tax=marine sediment metagenome TaxID=412755 RepID=A0A0F9T5H7_9ZZZZ